MATRKDVAALAGVSTATVSHVINQTKYVSDELRAKVLSAVEELNYVPNYAAQMMTTKKTNQITMLVSDISNPYYGEIAAGMEEVTRQNKYVLSISSTEGTPDNYITTIIERQTDGVFVAVTNHIYSSEIIEKLTRQRIPVVVATSSEAIEYDEMVSTISVNYATAMENMLTYLYDMGHRNTAYLVGLEEGSDDTRITLFDRFQHELGFNTDRQLVVFGDFPYRTNFESGYTSMNKLLERDLDFTAVFCTNDLMAFGAIKAIREANLRIPEDVSIIGCDNIFFSETSDPPLTTISIPKRELGRRVVELLFGAIEKKRLTSSRVNGELLIRASTGPVGNKKTEGR
ncbi:MAG: LacI family transcriptional regulator [Spirochaetia bacterium]|nr:LacI family transcriptional regulator [Spirochaetia bacterium]